MVRDPADTRRKLLDAARDEFARHGSAGARVDRIAAAAGVNKERIYGHFGNKDDLFAAALADSMRELTRELEGDDDHDLGGYVAHKLAYHAEHPDVSRLVLWETLERADAPIVAEEERRAIYARKVTAVAEMLGIDEQEARYAVLVGLALGTLERVFPHLVTMIAGDADGTVDRSELRARISAAAARAFSPAGPAAADRRP
jgi:AcrR family transcriptional regulator